MVAAARYADQYDGFLVGDPGFRLPLAAIANIAGAPALCDGRRRTRPTSRPASPPPSARSSPTPCSPSATRSTARPTAWCRTPSACQAAFDLDRDVPTCTGARDGTCLSAAQKTAIGKLFAGATTSTGTHDLFELPVRRGRRQRATRRSGSSPRRWSSTRARSASSGKVPPENPATFNGPAFALTGDVDTMLAKVHGHQRAPTPRSAHVVHDAAQPDRPVRAEEPRRQDDGLPRHQRSDLLERRHDRLVRRRCAAAQRRRCVATSRASSACPAWTTARAARRPTSSTC